MSIRMEDPAAHARRRADALGDLATLEAEVKALNAANAAEKRRQHLLRERAAEQREREQLAKYAPDGPVFAGAASPAPQPAPAAYAAPRPAPRAKTHAEQLAEARRWAAFWEAHWRYAVDGFTRHYGLSEVEAIRRIMREMPDLVKGRDAAATRLAKLGG